jgi:putative ABC transport system substrate-binding protein
MQYDRAGNIAANVDPRLPQDKMRRRLLITAGGAILVPFTAAAQPIRMPVIGVLVVGAPGSEEFYRLFRNDMRKLGYIDGQTVRYEFRSDRGEVNKLPELAAELVTLKVDVIVAWFTPAVLAAKQATRDIPIVMAAAGDAVASGLVESLARPGGNVTGTSGVAADLAGKCVELSRELLPGAKRVAALTNASDPFSRTLLDKIRLAGKATDIWIEPIPIHGAAELDSAFASLGKTQPDTVIVQPSLPVRRVAELALKFRLPTLGPVRTLAEEGGLMTYSSDISDLYLRSANVVAKILNGAKPADLPVELPTKFELVINLKTAKTIGLTIPASLLQRANEVLE